LSREFCVYLAQNRAFWCIFMLWRFKAEAVVAPDIRDWLAQLKDALYEHAALNAPHRGLAEYDFVGHAATLNSRRPARSADCLLAKVWQLLPFLIPSPVAMK